MPMVSGLWAMVNRVMFNELIVKFTFRSFSTSKWLVAWSRTSTDDGDVFAGLDGPMQIAKYRWHTRVSLTPQKGSFANVKYRGTELVEFRQFQA